MCWRDEKVNIANKSHTCDYCKGIILKGEKYIMRVHVPDYKCRGNVGEGEWQSDYDCGEDRFTIYREHLFNKHEFPISFEEV